MIHFMLIVSVGSKSYIKYHDLFLKQKTSEFAADDNGKRGGSNA